MSPTSRSVFERPAPGSRLSVFWSQHGPALCLFLALAGLFIWRVYYLRANEYVSNDTKSYLVTMQQVFGHDFTGRGLQRPPLIAIPLKIFALIWGEIDGSRLLSVLICVSIGWPFYVLARRVASPWVAALAAVLLVMSPMYSEMLSWGYITFFGIFFSLFALHFILYAWEQRTWKSVLLAGLMSSLVMGVHQTSFIIFVVMTLMLIVLVWLTRWVPRREGLATISLVVLCGVVLALPYVPSYLSQSTNLSGSYLPSLVHLRPLAELGTVLFIFFWRHAWLWVAAALAIVPGIIRLARPRTRDERGMGLVLAAISVAILSFNLLDSADLAARSLFWVFAVLWMLWAVGIMEIGVWLAGRVAWAQWSRPAGRALAVAAAGGMLLLAGCISQRHLSEASAYYNTLDPDQLAAISWMRDHLEPDGLIVTYPNGFSYWISALLGRPSDGPATASRGAWKEEGQRNQVALSALSAASSLDNGSLRLSSGYPYYRDTALAVGAYVNYAGVGAQSVDLLVLEEDLLTVADAQDIWGLADVSALQAESRQEGDTLSLWARHDWGEMSLERQAALAGESRQVTIEYRLSIPQDRLPAQVTLPVALDWCVESARDVGIIGLDVYAREARPSGELDYTITASSEGQVSGRVTQENCVLTYVWEVNSPDAVIRLTVDVTSTGAALNSVIARAEMPALLLENDIRYIAIDDTPTFAGDEPLSAYSAAWFGAAPYYHPIYQAQGVTVYRVDVSALDGPAERSDTTFSADGQADDAEATLLGWRQLAPAAQAGGTLTAVLYWQAQRPLSMDYVVFTHLYDEHNVVAQHDGVPCNQNCPTTAWAAGQAIIDLHSLALPADLAPGTYTLEAGLYRADSGERLPAFDSQGQRWPNDGVILGTVQVMP